MRSGNGRHRRPRQAPAIFVTAGVTGAGLALPLFAASGAQAADTSTWDKVAQCESGGVWSAASGNGYYGGLQLTQEMWDNYGGSSYASRPDLASRSQQIAVAESILDDRGPDAWPSCAVNAGLTDDGRAPEVDPGSTSTPAPDPSDSQGSLDPWDTPGSSDSHDGADSDGRNDRPSDEPSDESSGLPSDATPSPDASKSDEPGDSSASPEPSDPATPGDRGDDRHDDRHDDRDEDPSQSADPSDNPSADPSDGGSRTDSSGTPREVPGKGKHRGGAGDEEAGTGGGDGGRSSGGRHASRGDDAHRTGPAADGDYTVRPGDSLSAIATAHRLPGGWAELYDRNEGVIGSDADLIQPGQQLDLGRNAG
ncbi:LysM peptidoglycan-binding domain-containing protein [Streptomyces sp. SID8375]|nr:transglycosylase family protein [Streptomyces sp. SID8375]MYX06148.1 LysM peptidoglycan-binding domain-containing protein [Streptomyces sp. SID8375]